MTQQEKQKLFVALCGYLPYLVKCNINGELCKIERIDIEHHQFYLKKDDEHGGTYSIVRGDVIKPYLRPMSTMTEEEKKEYQLLQTVCGSYHYEFGDIVDDVELFDNFISIDWLNKNKFDYRGLIPMGLALEAPEGMYEDCTEKETNIPKTLEEAIIELDNELSQEDKDFLLENGALSVHHSLGTWIRNNWGLWGDSELKRVLIEQGLEHPDDMSNYIIEEYITHLKLK